MIKDSGGIIKQREEKIAQIKLLYDKAHEYKLKHADAWKTEEDSQKRTIRLNNLVELFKICELLKNVVTEQITPPAVTDEMEEEEEDDEDQEEVKQSLGWIDTFRSSIVLKSAQQIQSQKKKKKKKEKGEDFDKLKQESIRLTKVPKQMKVYHYKSEPQKGDSKITKFVNKIPKNQCLYCA